LMSTGMASYWDAWRVYRAAARVTRRLWRKHSPAWQGHEHSARSPTGPPSCSEQRTRPGARPAPARAQPQCRRQPHHRRDSASPGRGRIRRRVPKRPPAKTRAGLIPVTAWPPPTPPPQTGRDRCRRDQISGIRAGLQPCGASHNCTICAQTTEQSSRPSQTNIRRWGRSRSAMIVTLRHSRWRAPPAHVAAVISSPLFPVFAVAAGSVLCVFAASWRRYLNTVSATPPQIPC
jgi:hypothetical protein